MKHDAKAIGSGSEAAQAELQDQYTKVRPPVPPTTRPATTTNCMSLTHLDARFGDLKEMTLVEAQLLTLKILKQVMEEKLNEQNVQLAQVRLNLPLSLYLSLPSTILPAFDQDPSDSDCVCHR